MIVPMDLAWIAGFLEGEGSFGWNGSGHASGAEIKVTQVQREPLERLERLLGGKIYPASHKKRPVNVQWSPYFKWSMTGNRAVGLAMTVYVFMSPKRQEQIKKMLGIWRNRRPCAAKDWDHCCRGHPFTEENTRLHRGWRICRACARLLMARYRAKQVAA